VGGGIGRAVVERLLGDGHAVVAVELDPGALEGSGAIGLAGDAGDERVTEKAADLAEQAGTLAGWVNNAAVFRDASVHSSPTSTITELIALNLTPAVAGCATAVRRFLAHDTPGAIVNVTSHQAQRAVPGCAPYVTAKAAIEGLTRALAVEYGPQGIRVNAVAPGSISTERYEEQLAGAAPGERRRLHEDERLLHPLGRVGTSQEVAAAIVHLLSDDAAFITGAIVPVDGGRTIVGRDPEPPAAA
jgi:NAD(P)-dependent dehydrogenase (short-subunit alcohol dehydrogenase family)